MVARGPGGGSETLGCCGCNSSLLRHPQGVRDGGPLLLWVHQQCATAPPGQPAGLTWPRTPAVRGLRQGMPLL